MQTDYLTHLPPQAIDLELSLLATTIILNDSVDVVSDIVKPSHFYKTAHRKIYQAILDIKRKGDSIDLAMLAETLRSNGELENVGGAAFLSRVVDHPMSTSIESTANKIVEKAVLREAINTMNTYVGKCFDPSASMETIDELQGEIVKIELNNGDKAERVDVVASRYIDKLEYLSTQKKTVTGLPTGFPMLDQLTCGWQQSDLIFLAARPSMGKTALSLRFALTMGMENRPGLYFSMEMSREQIIMRMFGMEGKVNLLRLRSGKLSNQDWESITEAAGKIAAMPIHIDDSPALHYNEIRRTARRYWKRNKIEWIIIDYLQLAKGDFPGDPYKDTGSITGPLKAIAKELNIPVICLSQLNRKLEERSDKRPKLSDLRNSGNIEQDADVVMFIYRDEVYNRDDNNPNKGKAEINLAKQRNGPVDTFEAVFLNKTADFKPIYYGYDGVPIG